jgi:hypothetical protein
VFEIIKHEPIEVLEQGMDPLAIRNMEVEDENQESNNFQYSINKGTQTEWLSPHLANLENRRLNDDQINSHQKVQRKGLKLQKTVIIQGYDHVQAYSVVTYNFFWYKAYHFLGSSVISV